MTEMKIKIDNIDKFKRLGNLFPTLNDIEIFFTTMSPRMISLLNLITNNNITTMAIDYISKRRLKSLSTTVDLMLLNYGLVKTDDYYSLDNRGFEVLRKLVDMRFYTKWLKLFNTLSLQYDPIKPYVMSVADNTSETTDNKIDISRENNNTSVSNSTDNVVNDETIDSVYGFNSSESVDSDKSVNKSSGNSQESNTFNSNGSTNTKQDRVIDTDRNIERIGNIGNTTQQELIEKERDLWNYQIFDTIFKDLDSVLTNPLYK